MMTWLQRCQEMLLEGIAGLSDQDLQRPIQSDRFPTVRLENVLYLGINHDLYHAGELSHLRSIAQGNLQFTTEEEEGQGSHRWKVNSQVDLELTDILLLEF